MNREKVNGIHHPACLVDVDAPGRKIKLMPKPHITFKEEKSSMTLRQIVTLPEPILRRKAKPVTKFDKVLQTLIDDMIETMREAPGVGRRPPVRRLSPRVRPRGASPCLRGAA
mgnify:CR=1 FL=1